MGVGRGSSGVQWSSSAVLATVRDFRLLLSSEWWDWVCVASFLIVGVYPESSVSRRQEWSTAGLDR